jgi:hypothetical protein
MKIPFAQLAALALASIPLAAACGSSASGGPFVNGGSSSGGGGSSGGGAAAGSGSGSGGSTVILGSDDAGSSTSTISPEAGCATASATATRAPVYMLFVLDGSGSMGQDNKWTAVTGALTSIFASMENNAGIAAGLIVFADSMDQTLNTGPGPYPEPGIDVPIGYVTTAQNMALDQRMSGSPNSSTPTYYALQGGYGELGSFTPVETGGSKVLVLITDGVPTDQYCSTAHAGTNYPTNPCVVMAAQQDSAKPPVLTFVIGVGQFPSSNAQDFDPAWLGNLALAGGGAPAGCNPNETQTDTDLCYFEVDPTQAASASALQTSFTNALDAISGQVLSCTFPLQSTGLGAIDPTLVNVTVDGTTVPQSPTDGWTFDNPSAPTAIVFNGAACSSLKTDASAQVSIVVGCATVVAK